MTKFGGDEREVTQNMMREPKFHTIQHSRSIEEGPRTGLLDDVLFARGNTG